MKSQEEFTLTKLQAITIYESGLWEDMSIKERCSLMLLSGLCCYPFTQFHQDLEECLDRPVYTHEMGLNWKGLVAEFLKEKEAPILEEILSLIPKEKRIILLAEPSKEDEGDEWKRLLS